MGLPDETEMTERTTALRNWGDDQQYDAEPHFTGPNGVQPKVTLLSMSPDPLGVLAAFCAMYEGRVVRDLNEITGYDRQRALSDVQQTHLKAPLESVKVHFLLEGVDRAFTHQLVRQRTAVFAQESMRFAVLGDLLDATTLPPSLEKTERKAGWSGGLRGLQLTNEYEMMSKDDRRRAVWDYVIDTIDSGYHLLVDNGMPAEEARGLLPHATATRIHFVTDLRNLTDHAGNRLCTQAQFHWRQVFSQMVQELRDHSTGGAAIADSNLFRPACYQLGHCPFEASFDRACTIRDRVEKLAAQGVPSDLWTEYGINPAEWLLDPSAARR